MQMRTYMSYSHSHHHHNTDSDIIYKHQGYKQHQSYTSSQTWISSERSSFFFVRFVFTLYPQTIQPHQKVNTILASSLFLARKVTFK